MTAKKTPIAPNVAPLPDTATLPMPHGLDQGMDILAAGLGRTLARRRSDPVALLKAGKPARPVKTDPAMSGKPAKSVRKAHIGPRSGHK